MRDLVTTAMEVTGFACLVAAAFTVSLLLGFVALGVVLITLGVLVGRG